MNHYWILLRQVNADLIVLIGLRSIERCTKVSMFNNTTSLM